MPMMEPPSNPTDMTPAQIRAYRIADNKHIFEIKLFELFEEGSGFRGIDFMVSD